MHVLTLLLTASVAQAPELPKVDVSAYQDSLMLVTDGQKHYLAFDKKQGYSSPLFYGDGKLFNLVPVHGGGASGEESFSQNFWEPRLPPLEYSAPEFRMSDSGGKYAVSCGKKETVLKPVPAEEAKKLVAAADFRARRWTRLPEALVRDDKGTYYFVDRLRTEERADRRDFRLFIGPRGKLKPQPLRDIVDDTEGMIFSTKAGDLRLVLGGGKEDRKWISGKTETKLIDVPLDNLKNARMVYLDLGVYDGARLGTPCDDLM